MAVTYENNLTRGDVSRYLSYHFSRNETERRQNEATIGNFTAVYLRTFETLFGNLQLPTPENNNYFMDIIDEMYKGLGVSTNSNQFTSIRAPREEQLEPGDIILTNYNTGTTTLRYIACVERNDDNGLKTFPNMPASVKQNSYYERLYKLDFNSLTDEQKNRIKSVAGETLTYQPDQVLNSKIIVESAHHIPGMLQVGDIRFLVSPTQISFSTQNGYQYFPTIRTQGNPKVPTMQEVKQIHITLIFPNQESINNQLLPLLAMYKRAPFVNILNTDISNFFAEIKDEQNFVPVALETIQVQSVRGFPNTLQANISFLPFQREAIGISFRALTNFDGIQYQAWKNQTLANSIDSDIAESRARLYNRMSAFETVVPEHAVGKTSDFTLSEPFRAYYQGMLSYRDFVQDEMGRYVKKETPDGQKHGISTLPFKPTKDSGYLNKYRAEDNRNEPLNFEYKFIDMNVREFARKVREETQRAGMRLAADTRTMYDMMVANNDDFAGRLNLVYLNRENLYRSIQAKFNTFNNFMVEYFSMYNLDLQTPQMKKITSLTDLLFEMANKQFQIGQVSPHVISSVYRAFKGEDFGVNILPSEKINILSGLTFFNAETLQSQAAEAIIPSIANQLGVEFNAINAAARTGTSQFEDRKIVANFYQVLFDAASSQSGTIDLNTLNLGAGALSPSTAQLIIDNVNDVVDGWSLVFSNKFIPMHLSGFKYPFYQHIGGDDINISLSITSLQNGREEGLKEQLSQLNDRLQNTTKLILGGMPELIHSFDKNVRITNAKEGNIFNVFNIKNLVYDNSNIQSIPGKPNAWSITLNMTQDNFTLREYHSINRVNNTFDFDDDIMNLLIRSHIDPETGEVTVRNVTLDTQYFQNRISDLLQIDNAKLAAVQSMFPGLDITKTTLQQISELDLGSSQVLGELDPSMSLTTKQKINKILLSIFGTDHLNRYVNEHQSEITLPLQTIQESRLLQMDGFIIQEDRTATQRLNNVFNYNPRLKAVYKNVIGRIRDLHDIQSGVLFNAFKDIDRTVDAEKVLKSFRNSLYVNTALLVGGTAVVTAFNIPGLAIAAALAVVGLANTAYLFWQADRVRTVMRNQIITFVRENSAQFQSMFDNIKLQYTYQVARLVVKDPMFISDIFGETYKQKLQNYINRPGVPCYKDFDISTANISRIFDGISQDRRSITTLDFIFSPDFYLYNDDQTEREKLEFLMDELNNKMTIGQIMSFQILEEHKDNVELLNEIQEVVFTDKANDEVYRTIVADMNIVSGQNTSAINAATGGPSGANGSQDVTSGNQGTADAENETEVFNYDQALEQVKKVYATLVSRYRGTTLNNGQDAINIDGLKFNMIQVARNKRILQLKILQTAINDAISQQVNNANSEARQGVDEAEQNDIVDAVKTTLFGDSLESLRSFQSYINSYFTIHYKSAEDLRNLGQQGSTGNNIITDIQTSLSVNNYTPVSGTIDRFQKQVFTLLDQIQRLDTALRDAVGNNEIVGDTVYLDDIPELRFLKWYNWRRAEEELHNIEMLQQLNNYQTKDIKSKSNKLFPTFKIFFVEEDRKIIRSLDDYYSYEAVNSIDVVASKYSAGRTAVLKLSNVFNSLTDKLSLMTELLDDVARGVNYDDVFLGTLDVKPGTKMIIKMGYAADDRDLPTVFVGRITEMRPGPITEIISQSYGAQLNHYIEYLNFGFASSRNEHGDVAIAVLDQIPGLEGLGKQDLTGVTTTRFTGKNLQNITQNSFRKFLISNITDKFNVGLFASDNARDENIFLPVRLMSSVFDKATFDWMVYNQSVWQALGEISLYHRNTFPMVKFYNNDKYSNMDELRETIIIGDKAGYYKYTDAFSFSTMNYEKIKEAVDKWNSKIRHYLDRYFRYVYSGIGQEHRETAIRDSLGLRSILRSKEGGTTDPNDYASPMVIRENTVINNEGRASQNWDADLRYSEISVEIIEFFRDRNNMLVIIYLFLQHLKSTQYGSVQELVRGQVGQAWEILKEFPMFRDNNERALQNLAAVYNASTSFRLDQYFARLEGITQISGAGLRDAATEFDRSMYHVGLAFSYLLLYEPKDLKQMSNQSHLTEVARGNLGGRYKFDYNFFTKELSVEDFLHVEPPVLDNKETGLINHPAYTKIQKHHLVTDSSDILSNNIVVSENFSNAVRILYHDEPQVFSADNNIGIKKQDQKKLQQFTVKAFGDLNDGDTRMLESYQRNIDTNYHEIMQDGETLFSEWFSTQKTDSTDDSGSLAKYNDAIWSKLPAYLKVSIGLLQREVEQMYRGTIQVIGNPHLEPFDVLHINDVMNQMFGTVEIDEIVHTFNPTQGFVSTITPSMITYDRDPITLSDVGVLQNIMTLAKQRKDQFSLANGASMLIGGTMAGGAGLGLVSALVAGASITPVGWVIAGLSLIGGSAIAGSAIFDEVLGKEFKYTNFLYDHMANVFGRDCINFSTLTYHNAPLIGGFAGVDYTNLKTLINHQWNNGTIMQRLSSSNDIESTWIIGKGSFDNVGTLQGFALNSTHTPGFVKGFIAAKIFSDTNTGYNGSYIGGTIENAIRTGE